MRSSTAVGLDAAFGRFTSMPRYIIGAVSMKISRSTSTTSTSGMMLISARLVPMRRGPSDGSVVNAMASARPWRGPAQEIQEVEREAVHLRGPAFHTIHEVVVADDGRDRGAEARGRCDQRLRDPRRDDRQARRALLADAVKRGDDAPHRPEEPDERRRARGGCEEGKIALQLCDLEHGRSAEGAVGRLEPFGR